jgi:MFS superfamily sulfate permease-like transporter
MLKNLKNDFPASIVVFLVALPLCLGVALASGAPLLSGLISGIVGGIVVGFLSSSQTSVSGPAAGLAAVVLASITQLGSFEVFLAAVVIAGVIQLIFGIMKGGLIASYIPSNVIKGLLAAIGIILILKQIPHAFGVDKIAEDDFTFLQSDGENTFSELLRMLSIFTPGAVIISIVSLIILIYWHKTPLKNVKFFPSSLFVVLLGVALNYLFHNYLPTLAIIEPTHLVKIPTINLSDATTIFKFPDFSQLGNYHLWFTALTLAIIATVETLLNLEAVDNIDPHKRLSPPNRELIAQGVGNIASGLIGGIPITSVIVRSSVNINAGAETKFSTILHGVFLLLSVLFLTSVLNLIPLASLAAILLVTGYKLAKISLFKEMYAKGWNQFIPFAVTIVAIIFTDLLIGIIIGLVISIFFILRNNYKNPFTIEKEKLHVGETLRLELANQATFLNKATIKDTLWNAPPNSNVIVDATYCDYVDNDILEILHDYRYVVAPENNIQLNIIGLKDQYQLADHIQFVNILNKESQAKLTPNDVFELLKQGNERFVSGKWSEKYYKHQVNATSMGQFPMAVVISCVDSRSTPEVVFDTGIGDIVTIRIAGNIINDDIIGSVELACKELGTKLIVVMGHSRCGAVTVAVNSAAHGNITHITDKIEKSIITFSSSNSNTRSEQAIHSITWLNIHNSVKEIIDNSSYIKAQVEKGDIKIVSAFYETHSGRVLFEQ